MAEMGCGAQFGTNRQPSKYHLFPYYAYGHRQMSQFLGRPSDRQAFLGNHVLTYNCSKAASKPLIADGGIRYNSDIAKSVRFGATMVMIGSMGSMLASHEESPQVMLLRLTVKPTSNIGDPFKKSLPQR